MKWVCETCSNAIIQETDGDFSYDGSFEVAKERRIASDEVPFRLYCTVMHCYICQKEKLTKCSKYDGV